ncbi:FAD-dependent oxidoreductase [Rhodospirillaceae bacterium SYSU D60014]|uniref:dihydrolipoyl dehydrogenase family protein n=1 Tax=Virgifigura deserti TaxID=2268457 RepID=UPI000E660FE8
MTDLVKADICVVGAGSAGLTVAAGASQFGAATVLIEGRRMGGDCLNYGCVPSKALLAAGHAARAAGGGAPFGIADGAAEVDFRRVHDHVHAVIDAIAPQDSVERFEGLGVRVIQAEARFIGPRELIAGDGRVRARRFVVATGSAPAVPPIPGLDRMPYYTNETIFDLTERPDHLVVIGGGPIGCELAQAHRRLGARVSILEADRILPKDDPELVELLRQRLRADGIALYEQTKVVGVEGSAGAITARIERNGTTETVQGTVLLVATGRKPTVKGLDLEAAGVAYTDRGIAVDRRLRTSNRRIFAIGDVTGGFQFTHMAGYDAGIVIRNALFRLPAKVDHRAVPWVTYTDPELAHVGMTERQAREAGREIRILRWPFAENDRAQAERTTDGLIKVVTTPRGRILGASILGAHAGELIHVWVLAIGQNLKIGAIANMIAPYPTLGEVSKRAAGSFYTPTLFSERTRRLVRFLRLFG